MIGVEIIENAVEDAKANADLNGEFVHVASLHSLVLLLMDRRSHTYSSLPFFLNRL